MKTFKNIVKLLSISMKQIVCTFFCFPGVYFLGELSFIWSLGLSKYCCLHQSEAELNIHYLFRLYHMLKTSKISWRNTQKQCFCYRVFLHIHYSINLFQPSFAFLMETSHLIWAANQMTGFHLKCNTGLKWAIFLATLSRSLPGRVLACS